MIVRPNENLVFRPVTNPVRVRRFAQAEKNHKPKSQVLNLTQESNTPVGRVVFVGSGQYHSSRWLPPITRIPYVLKTEL